MRRLREALAWARRRWPWTSSGTALLAGGLACLRWGAAWSDRVMLAFGGTVVGLLVLTVAAALVVRWALGPAFRGPAVFSAGPRDPGSTRLIEGVATRSGLAVPSPWWAWPFALTWTCAAPAAEVTTTWRLDRRLEALRARRRGRYEALVREICLTDPLGTVQVVWEERAPGPVEVVPSPGALARAMVLPGWASGDVLDRPDGQAAGDLYDLRPYRPGDPLRLVLWKVYARTRRLVVRAPERAIAPEPEVAAWLVAGPGDDAAAGALWAALDQADDVPVCVGADGVAGASIDRAGARDIVLRSAVADADAQGSGLDAFLRQRPHARAVVFAPAVDGPWVERVLPVLADRPCDLLLCVDALSRPTPAPWWSRPDAGGADAAAPAREAVEALVGRFGGQVRVSLVDRRSGTVTAWAARRAA